MKLIAGMILGALLMSYSMAQSPSFHDKVITACYRAELEVYNLTHDLRKIPNASKKN